METALYMCLKMRCLYNKTEFIAYFLQRLNLTRDDIVILDRASDIGQAVLQHKGDSKVGVVIHADHYSNNMMSEQHILWNNYYEYQFSKAKYIEFLYYSNRYSKSYGLSTI